MSAMPKPKHAFQVGDEVAVVDIKTGKAKWLRTVQRLWHTGDVMFGPTGTRYRQDGTEIVYADRVYDGGFSDYGYDGHRGKPYATYREVTPAPTTFIRHPTDEDHAEIARLKVEAERAEIRAERIKRIRAVANRSTFSLYRDTRTELALEDLSDDQIARITAILDEDRTPA